MREILKFFQDMFLDLYDNFQEVFLNILVMIIVMIMGLIISWFIKKLLVRVLVLFRFDKWAQDAGINEFLEKGGIHTPASLILGKIVYWVSIVLFLSFGLNYMGMTQFSEYASRISTALPNIVVSLMIVIMGIIFSNFLGRVIYLTCENAKIKYGDFIAKGVRVLLIIITFGIVFEYIGLGNTIVTISFLIIFGGIILTMSLALGIGLSSVLGDVIRDRAKLKNDKNNKHKEQQ